MLPKKLITILQICSLSTLFAVFFLLYDSSVSDLFEMRIPPFINSMSSFITGNVITESLPPCSSVRHFISYFVFLSPRKAWEFSLTFSASFIQCCLANLKYFLKRNRERFSRCHWQKMNNVILNFTATKECDDVHAYFRNFRPVIEHRSMAIYFLPRFIDKHFNRTRRNFKHSINKSGEINRFNR